MGIAGIRKRILKKKEIWGGGGNAYIYEAERGIGASSSKQSSRNRGRQ